MPNALRSYACDDCGLPVVRPARPDRPKLCTDCAIARVADNAYRRAAYGQSRRAVIRRQSVTTGGQ